MTSRSKSTPSRKAASSSPLAKKTVRVTVTEENVKRGTLTLPEIEAEVKPIAAVGQTPSLKFTRPDGTDGTLADFRGRPTVVQFWASWCGPCKEQLPELRRLYAQSGEKDFALVGLSLDEDAEVWKTALDKLNPPWPQGRLVCAEGFRCLNRADVLAAGCGGEDRGEGVQGGSTS